MHGDPPVDGNVINKDLQNAMRDLSRSKYGRPKAQVDAEIAQSLSTSTTPPTPTDTGASGMGSEPTGN